MCSFLVGKGPFIEPFLKVQTLRTYVDNIMELNFELSFCQLDSIKSFQEVDHQKG